MSKIEQIITEIEEYIDGSKFQPLSNTKLIVNKDTIEELLAELRLKIPEEIKKYQKIINNREMILNDAKQKADAMIAEAAAQTTELVSEHEIMQQAYIQANDIVQQATNQAQMIIDNATTDANNIRMGAMQYTDDICPSENERGVPCGRQRQILLASDICILCCRSIHPEPSFDDRLRFLGLYAAAFCFGVPEPPCSGA